MNSGPELCLGRRSSRASNVQNEKYSVEEAPERNRKRKAKKFHCTDCNSKSFTSLKKLNRHISVVHENKVHQTSICEICSATLTSPSYLRRHMLAKHPAKPRLFICDFDGKEFPMKDYLRVHMDRHRKHQILTCTVCQKSFISKHTFRKHLMMHIEKYECDVCKQVFSHKTQLENHTASKHSDELPFSCNFCTRLFASKSARNNHQYMTHKDNSKELKHKCHECNIPFEMKEELRIHSFIHFKGEIQTCLECYQIFKTPRLLKIHMEKHNSQKSFECVTCGDLFTFKTGLAKHIRMNRCKGPKSTDDSAAEKSKSDEVEIAKSLLKKLSKTSRKPKPLKKTFKQLRPKKKEDQRKNQNTLTLIPETPKDSQVEVKDEEPKLKETRKIRAAKNLTKSLIQQRISRPRLVYTCDFCGVKIKFKKNFIEHLKIHQSDFKCSDCESVFKDYGQLAKHSIRYHGLNIKSMKLSCEICGRKFDMRCKLQAHKLSHDENARTHVCKVCNAAFKSVGNLHRHEETHVETRDFHCPDCVKSFKTKLALKVHKDSVHIDVKVFVNCPECNLIVLETTLKTHMKNQHTEEGRDKPFKCIDCDKTFRSEIHGLRHWSTVHDPKPLGVIYRCPECPDIEFYRQRDLKEHSFIHYDGVVFQCEVCQKKFTSKRLLNAHCAVHDESEVRNFCCKICEKVLFKTRGGLRKHMINIHRNQQVVELDA